MPDLPKVPGFSAFGYPTPDPKAAAAKVVIEKAKCPPCESVPEVLILDKSDLPKPKVKIGIASMAQTGAEEEYEGFEETFLAQLDHFAY